MEDKEMQKKGRLKKGLGILSAVLVLAAAIFGFVIWSARSAASETIDDYNAAAQAYNEKIVPYNEAAGAIAAANDELQGMMDTAQSVLDEKKEAYEPETHKALQEKIRQGKKAMADVPVQIDPFEMRTVTGGWSREELQKQKAEAEAAKQAVEEASDKIPPVPEVPDYSTQTEEIRQAQKAYMDSVQKLTNVTAPQDSFVMERLQEIETVGQTGAVTKGHDPNGLLGRPDGYIGCVYFLDERVDRDLLPQEAFLEQNEADGDGDDENPEEEAESAEERDSESGKAAAGETAATAALAAEEISETADPGIDIIGIGTDGGGAVEVYATEEEAEKRVEYLGFFRGSVMDPGSCAVEGTCVIRTSKYLDEEVQKELTKDVRRALLRVEE